MSEFTEWLNTKYNGHIGKIIFQALKDNENEIHQINVVTDTKETNGSVRKRTIQVALALQEKGIKQGDIVMICAMNHNDTGIPIIACTYIGAIAVNLAVGMTTDEVKHLISLAHPKIVFTDPCMVEIFENVLREFKSDTEIIVFATENMGGKYMKTFKEFSKPKGAEEDFKCTDFDPEKTTCVAVCSSGTTGLPKLVSISHQAIAIILIAPVIQMHGKTKRDSYSKYLSFSPILWITGIYSVLGSGAVGFTRVQSSKPFTPEIAYKAIEKYRPKSMLLSPIALYEMTKYPERMNRDLSSLNMVACGGSALNKEVVADFQKLLPNGKVSITLGSTEAGNIATCLGFVNGSVGKINPWLKWKIVDPETEEVLGPNRPGELRIQTLMMFQNYYNDPESTKNAFDSENYYKTGDMLTYDEEGYFYFVDRCKEVIKHRNFQIAPSELENKICSLPEVMIAGVVGIPDPANGELPMAFVQLVPGASVSAQTIKDLIKDSLADYKQLRGGIVFMDNLPLTHTGKINRKALNTLKHTVKGE